MSDKELIAEATAHIDNTLAGIGTDESSVRAAWARGEGSDDRFSLLVRLRDRLADALEARQPNDEGEYILRLIETIKQTGGSVEIHGVKIVPCDEYGRTAAVPDAATSAADENLFFAKQTFDEITEERDAALAALERVRAIHQKRGASLPHNGGVYVCGADNGIWPCPTIQALDGAPEPEAWHYGRSWKGTRLEDECPCAKQHCGLVTLADAETVDCGQHAVKYSKTMRQSHSSSNCPGKPHDEHVKVTECWPMGCIEGDCEHRDEFGEPEGLESCPRTPMEVCVECMVSMGGGSDPTRWEEHLAPWPCSKTVRLPVEGEKP